MFQILLPVYARASFTTYTYDGNGNMLTDGVHTNTWNYRNELQSVTTGSSTTTYQYDHTGQRIKSMTGTTTTYTPTRYYTYDGTKKTKTIYLGDMPIANVDTVGGINTTTYTLTDTLGSVDKTTDTTGAVISSTDYYPYGAQHIVPTPQPNRSYIGERLDSTGYNYLNARYYDNQRGQFLSQDPVFWSTKQNLMNPQSLNSYSYANDNPITGKDASGLVVVTISGTNPLSLGGGKTDYLKDSDTLQKDIHSSFPGQDILNFNNWSGADSDIARQQGAQNFGVYVKNIMGNYSATEPLNVVCHSHGCNVAALYTQQSDAHQIHNLIGFGQPVLSQYVDNENRIDNHINVYSTRDMVQRIGGTQTSASAILGGLLGGIPGYVLGQMIGFDQGGLAGRRVAGAMYNQNVTKDNRGNPISAHKDLYNNKDIWNNSIFDKIIK